MQTRMHAQCISCGDFIMNGRVCCYMYVRNVSRALCGDDTRRAHRFYLVHIAPPHNVARRLIARAYYYVLSFGIVSGIIRLSSHSFGCGVGATNKAPDAAMTAFSRSPTDD